MRSPAHVIESTTADDLITLSNINVTTASSGLNLDALTFTGNGTGAEWQAALTSLDTAVIVTVPAGKAVRLLEEYGGWVRIQSDGGATGWVETPQCGPVGSGPTLELLASLAGAHRTASPRRSTRGASASPCSASRPRRWSASVSSR
jgi:hypothetical protein